MKRVFRNAMMFGILAGMLSFTSCGDNKKKEEKTNSEQQEMKQPEVKGHVNEGETAETTAEFSDEVTGAIYASYAEIKDALVASDAEKAKAAASDLVKKVEEKSNEGLDEITSAAGEIASLDDVNKQREAFSKLTAAMGDVLESSIASGEIYKQFCPMAFQGKGDYWYSNTKEIYNPYFGEKMLKCGRTEETIAKK